MRGARARTLHVERPLAARLERPLPVAGRVAFRGRKQSAEAGHARHSFHVVSGRRRRRRGAGRPHECQAAGAVLAARGVRVCATLAARVSRRAAQAGGPAPAQQRQRRSSRGAAELASMGAPSAPHPARSDRARPALQWCTNDDERTAAPPGVRLRRCLRARPPPARAPQRAASGSRGTRAAATRCGPISASAWRTRPPPPRARRCARTTSSACTTARRRARLRPSARARPRRAQASRGVGGRALRRVASSAPRAVARARVRRGLERAHLSPLTPAPDRLPPPRAQYDRINSINRERKRVVEGDLSRRKAARAPPRTTPSEPPLLPAGAAPPAAAPCCRSRARGARGSKRGPARVDCRSR